MSDPELSVVVPSYNGGLRLRATLPRIMAAIAASRVSSAEVIVVDDGSNPANHDMVQRFIAASAGAPVSRTTSRRPRVGTGMVPGIVAAGPREDGAGAVQLLLVCLPRNRGQQTATIIGAGLTRGQLVATLDDDGDHPPEELPAMIERMREDPQLDLLYGAPLQSKGRLPVYRRLGTSLNNLLFRISVGKPWDVPVTSFRIIRADHLARALALPIRFPYLSAMLFGASPAPRVAVHRYPARGTSSTRYSPLRLGRVFWGLLLYWGPLRGVGRLVRRRRPFDIAGGCL